MCHGLIKQKKVQFSDVHKRSDCIVGPVLLNLVVRSFQTCGPATANDLSPNVPLRRGMRQTDRSADLRVRSASNTLSLANYSPFGKI